MKYTAKIQEEEKLNYLEKCSGWLVNELATIGIKVPLFSLDYRLSPDPKGYDYTVKLHCQIAGDYKQFARIAESCFLDSAEPERDVLIGLLCNRIKRTEVSNYDLMNHYVVLKGDLDFGIDYPSLLASEVPIYKLSEAKPETDFDIDREQLLLTWIKETDKKITPDHPNWTSSRFIKVCHYLPTENKGE